MEIPNEVKAKVFAQYLGQNLLVTWPDHPIASEEKLLGIELSGAVHTPEMQFGMDKKDVLILRPLSAITDEDAIGVAKLVHEPDLESTFEVFRSEGHKPEYVTVWERRVNPGRRVAVQFTVDNYDKSTGSIALGQHVSPIGSGIKTLQAYQYLQSKGYDLPMWLLGGKTLKEAGLAIYQ